MLEINADDARRRFSELLNRAYNGEVSIIKKRGVPYAALVPLDQQKNYAKGPSVLALRGSGKGLWGDDVTKTINEGRMSSFK
jgi:prevent-host-death family protein